MTKIMDMDIWDRDFSLEVVYDCNSDETVTNEQMKAEKEFVSHPEWLAKAKSTIEGYCKAKVMADDENKKKDNIFSYIKPHYLLIKRNEEHPRVALMCKYRYDPEHGLAIVFSYDGEVEVGPQDIIL